MEVKTYELKWDTEVISSKVLFEIKQTSIKGTFYWNSHGEKIPWEYQGKKSFSRKCADVKVIEKKISLKGVNHVFTQWDLYLNGEKYPLEIESYRISASGNVSVKCEVGCG